MRKALKRLALGVAMKKLFAALLVSVSAVPASANLLQNPSFNSGTAFGWSGVALTLGPAGPAGGAPGAPGGYAAAMACSNASALNNNGCSISQSITTVVGQSYDVSFWAYNLNSTIADATRQQFKVLFGTNNLGVTSYGLSKVWTEFKMSVVATSTTTLFRLYARNDLSTTYYDGFSIVATPLAVPEPAILGLFGLGVVGLGLGRRRRGSPADSAI